MMVIKYLCRLITIQVVYENLRYYNVFLRVEVRHLEKSGPGFPFNGRCLKLD